MTKKKKKEDTTRRKFLKFGLTAGAGAALGAGLLSSCSNDKSGEKVKLLTPDGKLVEVDKSQVDAASYSATNEEARKGIPGKKFVMIIDLSRCKNARKCTDACQKMHHLTPDREWLKVLKMQDAETTAPYWMPKPCFHCDKPPCVKVCPVDATYKRTDGIVLVDNERCIGCRFCMAACPYSARVFNWGEPELPENVKDLTYSPETSVPSRIGTVEKCDFCPDMLRKGKLPHCVPACPNGVFYFGDMNEDTVTNGDETIQFSELIKDKAGYRLMEDLGTDPSVYYLPPASRLFPFKEPKEEIEETENQHS